MAQQLSISELIRLIRRPGFWILIAIFALIAIPHYEEELKHPAFLSHLTDNLGLDRHAFERILFLGPIIWAGFLFGQRGAMVASFVALACMLPRAIIISPSPSDAIFEASAVFIVGNLVALSFNSLRKERVRRIQLAALNQISSVVSQSLELSQILDRSIDNVMEVMRVDAALVFLTDKEASELALAAYKGISSEFAQSGDRIKLGEGFNGRVAETGEPLFVVDASQDPGLTRVEVRDANIHSLLIVPLRSKGEVMGTLCVAMRSQRWFRPEEIDLLTAIGNQIGVAVENARLYEQEREVAAQLRESEERYRELFENAHDAIWLHDLEGNIIAANKACARLTGYDLEELRRLKSSELLSGNSLGVARYTEQLLSKGEASGSVSEVEIIRKDGTEAFIQLATSVVLSDGQPTAFQHIARDVTKEKRMQENLRFYLREVTKAQEEERKRIARELHDETIQALVVLARQLDDLASSGKGLSKENRLLLENLWQQTSNMMEDVRRLSQDLRPPALDRLGLLPALEWLASDVAKYSGVTVEVKAHGAERRLPAEVELLLFRMAQEALRNVWRHSQATDAEVVVEFDDGKTGMTIKDNGKGFDPPGSVGDLARDGKLGLAGMQERARLLGGTLTVQSELGRGTTITVVVPA